MITLIFSTLSILLISAVSFVFISKFELECYKVLRVEQVNEPYIGLIQENLIENSV